MSKHRFDLTVEVDDEALTEHNDGSSPFKLPPTDEWSEDDLNLALGLEIATVDEIESYRYTP